MGVYLLEAEKTARSPNEQDETFNLSTKPLISSRPQASWAVVISHHYTDIELPSVMQFQLKACLAKGIARQ